MPKSPTFDIITLGSITLDTFVKPTETHITHCRETNVDKFWYEVGEKVRIKTVAKHVGGGSANSSVGFARMGLKVAAYGTIGFDTHGEFVLHQLEKNNVDTAKIKIQKNYPTSYSVIFMFEDGRRTVFNEKVHPLKFSPIVSTRAIYAGHVAEEEAGIFDDIIDWKTKHPDGLFAWNPGKTQFSKGIKEFANVLQKTDLLILNVEEAELFVGVQVPRMPRTQFPGKTLHPKIGCSASISDCTELAYEILSFGVKHLVITDGQHGAQYFSQDKSVFVPMLSCEEPVSTLGAGDSFAVGAVTALLENGPDVAENMLMYGSLNASSVVMNFGAQNGLLTRKELGKRYGKFGR